MNSVTYIPRTSSDDSAEYEAEKLNASPVLSNNSHHLAAHSFAQTYGLHPGMGLLLFVVNSMLFGGQVITGLAMWPLALLVALVLGVITFMAQRKWYGDDDENAFTKSLIVTLLTAIPTGLPGYLCIPAAFIGLFRRKES